MLKSPPSDIVDIIEACCKNQQAACKQLYEMYKSSLFAICLRYSSNREEAEDWLQDGFISIFKNIKKFDLDKGAFYTWSSKIIINTILMSKRKQNLKFDSINQSDRIEPINASFESNILSNIQYKDLVALIQNLPNGFKTVFNLYVIEGYSHKEIGQLIGISESTSKTQLMRAKQALKKKIESQNTINSNQLINYLGQSF